ncbi:MAG: hypothetical protein HPY50_21765 [Firmicutes bacterium]|nr:hypothetical protein [Bacillota bacterium]
MCGFVFFRPPTGCLYYGPCQPTMPRQRRPMRMEEEVYMEEEIDMDFDEMEPEEMERGNREYRAGEDYENRRFRRRYPYRYTCPRRARRC